MSTQPAAQASLGEGLSALRLQWARSRILRFGVSAAVLIVAVEGLLQWRAHTEQLRSQATDLALAMSSERGLLRQAEWPARKIEAERQLRAVRSMVWQASDPALAQAGMLDWLRATATTSGLNVREAQATRQVGLGTGAATGAGASNDDAGLQRDGYVVWRVRMSLEFKRAALLVFLQELSAYPKVFVVERLQMRPGTPGAVVELELRAVSGTEGSRP